MQYVVVNVSFSYFNELGYAAQLSLEMFEIHVFVSEFGNTKN